MRTNTVKTTIPLIPLILLLVGCNLICASSARGDVTRDAEVEAIYNCHLMLEQKQIAKAEDEVSGLVKRYPDNPNVYQLRGRLLSRKGQYAKAEADHQKALQLNQAYKPAANSRGDIFRSRQDYRRAAAAYEYAYSLDPTDDKIVLTLRKLYSQARLPRDHDKTVLQNNQLWHAVELEKKGKSTEALKEYNDYIRKFPGAACAYQYRANLHFYARDYKKAYEDYSRAIKCNPCDASSYASAASCLENLNEGERACEYFERALESTKNAVGYVYRYGNLLRKLKKYNKAIALYTRLLRRETDNSDAYRFRGDCYFAERQYVRALADYTDALENSAFPSPDTYRQRALVYEKLGQPDKAKRDRERAIDSM
jgi:tetratricopeptide (TPR) repeat protein